MPARPVDQKVKVLYIEDNRENRMLVRAVLEAAGYRIVDAEDGLAGIEAAIREEPALILLDINLPGVDGYEIVAILKSFPNLAATPVIAVTAYAMQGDREHQPARGAHRAPGSAGFRASRFGPPAAKCPGRHGGLGGRRLDRGGVEASPHRARTSARRDDRAARASARREGRRGAAAQDRRRSGGHRGRELASVRRGHAPARGDAGAPAAHRDPARGEPGRQCDPRAERNPPQNDAGNGPGARRRHRRSLAADRGRPLRADRRLSRPQGAPGGARERRPQIARSPRE